jgi:transposase
VTSEFHKNNSKRSNAIIKRTTFLGHLGIIVSLFRELEVDKLIDEKFPKSRDHKVSHANCILAMVLNGLGFVGQPLYLCPDYFKNVSVGRLFGNGIQKEDLNQYVIGETLDKIAEYGPTELFTEIVLHILKRLPIPILCCHADTTTISFHGDHDGDGDEDSKLITFGRPKNGRWDLKQLVLNMIVNQHGIPLFMSTHAGNASDKKIIVEAIESLKSSVTPEKKVYYLADSAFYSDDNIKKMNKSFWISRVPNTLNDVKNLISSHREMKPLKGDERYSFSRTFVEYAGIVQNWVLLLSHNLKGKKEVTLSNSFDKKVKEAEKNLNKLKSKHFFCEADALEGAENWIKDFPFLTFQKLDLKILKKRESGKRGRPAKDEKLMAYYSVDAEIKLNEAYLDQNMEKAGLFVLASNDLSLSPEEMLTKYKDQDKVEKGFRFLKSDTFSVSKVYLKNEGRIQALMMVMVLCLMIYSIAEWKLREKLEKENESVPDQKGKLTKKPTMRWIFFKFQGITELCTQEEGEIEAEVLNMEEFHWKVLGLLGEEYENMYL